MPRHFTLIAAFILAAFFANAQKPRASLIQVGFIGGVNVSAFTNDVGAFAPPNNYRFGRAFRVAPLVGFQAQRGLTRGLAASAGLEFTPLGMAYQKDNNAVVVINANGAEQAKDRFVFKINYAGMPLALRYDLAQRSPEFRVQVLGGIEPLFVLAQRVTYNTYESRNGTPVANSISKDGVLNDVRPFNVAALGGIEVGRKDLHGFYGMARFSYLLQPVFEKSRTADGQNLSTNMWALTAGFGFYFH